MKDSRDTMNLLQLNHQKLDLDIKLLLNPEQLQRYKEIRSGANDKPGQGRQTPMLFGKLTSMNLTDKTFSLTAKDPEGNELVFKVTFRDGTKFIRDQKLAKPEDFKDGEEVTVAGNINKEAKTIDAMLIALGKVKPPKGPGK